MHKNKLLIGATAVTAALLLSGCSPADDTGSGTPLESAPSQTDDETTQPEQPDSDSPADSSTIDAKRAAELALEAVPGTVVELELDQEGTVLQWEIGVLTDDGAGVEVHIDNASGEVLNQHELRLSAAQKVAPKKSIDAVIQIAQDAVGGAVTEAELDTENGLVVWEVTVFNDPTEWDLDIDAATGKVVKKEQDQ